MGSCEKDDEEPPKRQKGKIAYSDVTIGFADGSLRINQKMTEYDFRSNQIDLYTEEGNHFNLKILDLEAGESTPERLYYTCSDIVWGDFRLSGKPTIYLDKMNDILYTKDIILRSESGGYFKIGTISFYR